MTARKVSWWIAALALVLLFSACAGRKYIMPEKEIERVSALKMEKYTVAWCDFHPVLLMSEGIGIRHDLHLEDSRAFAGIKVVSEDKRIQLMVIITESVDLNKTKAVISSRSGRHFYTVDGKSVFSRDGHLVPRLNWDKIQSLAKSQIEIWPEVKLDSEQDKRVKKILVEIGKGIDQQKIPGLFDRVMSRVAKITTEDVILAGATNFSSLFAILGVRVWAIVEVFVQKADLSLPYYDTALVDRFQLSLTLQPIQEQLGSLNKEQEQALKKWQEEMDNFQAQKSNYEKNLKDWLRQKSEFEAR